MYDKEFMKKMLEEEKKDKCYECNNREKCNEHREMKRFCDFIDSK